MPADGNRKPAHPVPDTTDLIHTLRTVTLGAGDCPQFSLHPSIQLRLDAPAPGQLAGATIYRYQNQVHPQGPEPLEHPRPEEGAEVLVRTESPRPQPPFNKYSRRQANPSQSEPLHLATTIFTDLETTMIVDGLTSSDFHKRRAHFCQFEPPSSGGTVPVPMQSSCGTFLLPGIGMASRAVTRALPKPWESECYLNNFRGLDGCVYWPARDGQAPGL